MRKLLCITSIAAAGIVGMAGITTAEPIKEGQWSMTVETQMSGMQEEQAQAMKEMDNMPEEQKAMMQQMMGKMNMQMGAGGTGMKTTVTQCITNDNPVPESNQEEGCTQTHEMKGNAIHFEVTCPDSRSTGDVKYMGDKMNGTIKSQSNAGGRPTDATIKIEGKYIGPCTKETVSKKMGR